MRNSVIKKLVAGINDASLDAVIGISPENFAYTTGFIVPSHPVLRWRHALTVITADGQNAVMCVDMEESTVRERMPNTDLRVWKEFSYDAMPILAELLDDLGLKNARVGIEMDYIPAGDMAMLRKHLPNTRWEAAEQLYNKLRMIKTPEELEILKNLSRITDSAIKTALESVTAGSTEMDIAAAVTSSILRNGADDYKFLIVASGERSQYPNVGPTDRILIEKDLIRLEIFGMLSGYHAGICRTASVGNPTEEAEQIWSNLSECREIKLENIRPGVKASDVYSKFLEKFGELALKPISFVGHGIGLFLHEEPYLGANSDTILESGMVLGIEPLAYVEGRFGLQCKDMIVITQDGCQLFSDVTNTDNIFLVS